MSNISVRVNLGDFQRNMQTLVQDLSTKVDNRTQEAGINVQAQAKINAPVGTPESTHKKGYHGGRFRNSIAYQNMGFGHSKVYSDLYYAGFVNDGTRKMRARPVVTNAFINERAAWMADLQDMV